MGIAMNSSNSGFRKWTEAQELKRIGEVGVRGVEGGGDAPIAVGIPILGAHRVTGGGRPPPVPTERSVRISRTTLFRR